jgi:magnesium transporter
MSETYQGPVDAIRRLARRGANNSLRRALAKSRPEDIAVAVGHLAPAEQRLVMSLLEDDQVLADVLTRADDAEVPALTRQIGFERLVSALDHMEVDDEADIIAKLPEELRAQVLSAIEQSDKEHLDEILAWPEDSAGGIMQPLALRLQEDLTCRDAVHALHEQQEDLEMVFYVYVENADGQLVGVTSLRALLTHPPSTPLSELVTSDVISVTPETDQEEVARIVSRYGLLAVPVVDSSRHLLGIVTIDDVVDVIREEAAEDMMLMAGVGDELEPHLASSFRSARQRLPWLLVTLLGGVMMAELIGFFEGVLESEAVVAGFIPVMMGMGGNVGIQAATLAVRNIAVGAVDAQGSVSTVLREARVGLLLGLAFAAVLGGYAGLRHQRPVLGVAIAAAVATELVVATALGSAIPLVMRRLGADPAIATGPFVTTCIDLVAIAIYFASCTFFLGL